MELRRQPRYKHLTSYYRIVDIHTAYAMAPAYAANELRAAGIVYVSADPKQHRADRPSSR